MKHLGLFIFDYVLTAPCVLDGFRFWLCKIYVLGVKIIWVTSKPFTTEEYKDILSKHSANSKLVNEFALEY